MVPGIDLCGEVISSACSQYRIGDILMATGWGLDANVKEAYRFLVENYAVDANGHGDSIHIFGFSRGAYTARVLAGCFAGKRPEKSGSRSLPLESQCGETSPPSGV
ncbi:MAG: hypothetical protein HC810_07385 [Acaryochloridaceae cyanobacterium RL_2_7]|nr:hypothetical protein [Acaryochloridaceae cyanobacterium RL_2_7]